MKRLLFGIILFLFFLYPAEAAIFTVCSSGCDQSTIQAGINAAANGDEVRITDSREYWENITLNKSINLTSNSSILPLIWTNSTLHTINVTVSNSIINNFLIKYNGTSSSIHALNLQGVSNTTIYKNNFTATGTTSSCINLISASSNNISFNNFSATGTFSKGVQWWSGTNNLNYVGNNTIDTTGDSGVGIDVSSSHNYIFANNVTTSTSSPIRITGSGTNNTVIYNIVRTTSFGEAGIVVQANGNNITNNIINNTGGDSDIYGMLVQGENNTISFNNISVSTSGSNGYGVYMLGGNRNYLLSNNITTSGTNSHGLFFSSGADNYTVVSNIVNVSGTTAYGIYFAGSNNNTIIDSIINSTSASDIRLYDVGWPNVTNVIINSSYNKSDISSNSATDYSILYNQYYLDLQVTDQYNLPIAGATLTITDNRLATSLNPTGTITATTDASGRIPRQTLTEFFANGTYNASSGFIQFSNYQVQATKSGVTSSAQLNVTGNFIIDLDLNIPPPSPISAPTTNIATPQDPTIFPPTEIPIPPPETTFDLPATGITIRLDPKLVLTLYPLTKKKATVHNITQIEPSRYKVLLCNQTEIASYEINISSDLAYFCANYSGFPVEDPTVSIFRFVQENWSLLSEDKIIKNSSNKIICGQVSSTPYLVSGFESNPNSKTALQTIKEANDTIELGKQQNLSTEKAESLLSQAVENYYSCNYITSNSLADQALNSLVVLPNIPVYVPIVIGSVVTIATVWYLFLRAKVRIKLKPT